MSVQTAPPIGHNSGTVHELDAKRDAIVAFVEKIKEARRLEDALTAAEFIAMDSSGKLSTMKKTRLDMLVRLHALDPKLDVDASICVLIIDLADNEYGKSNITIARLAALLSRDVSTIQRAISRLAEKYLIIRERPETGAVRRNTYRPYILRTLADQSTTLKSVMDAYAPVEEYKKPGRPARFSEIIEKKAETYKAPAACTVVGEPTGRVLPYRFPEDRNLPGADEKPTGRMVPVTEESLKGISKGSEDSGTSYQSDEQKPSFTFEGGAQKTLGSETVETPSNVEIIEPEEVGTRDAFGAKPSKAKRGKRKPKADAPEKVYGLGESGGRGKLWGWFSEEDQQAILMTAPALIVGREAEGYTVEWLRDRVRSFLNDRKTSAGRPSNDWKATLEQWVLDPRFKPRPAYGRARPSINDIADDVFSYKD